MTDQTRIVFSDTVSKTHKPLATGDKISGTVIKISADANNALVVGSDDGLHVTATAVFDDQVFTGDTSGNLAVTLTPSTPSGSDNQVDYSLKVDLIPSTDAGNAIVNGTDGKPFVPSRSADITGTVDEDSSVEEVSYNYAGDRDLTLGRPTKWIAMADSTGTLGAVPWYAITP